MTLGRELEQVKKRVQTPLGEAVYYDLKVLEEAGLARGVDSMPPSIKILLENVVRSAAGGVASMEDVKIVGGFSGQQDGRREIPFMPGRVLLQDFTGVPLIVDLAAMREVVARLGGETSNVNPKIPTHLVIDHSIQVDFFASKDAYLRNLSLEFSRNRERYTLLKWAQDAFKNFYVVPPGRGIVHQINLEYLAKVVSVEVQGPDGLIAFPDTLLGTDSHTPMVNGMGVLGWGVGGIEAEAVMLGQPYYMPLPEVVGVRLVGELRPPATATDLVLTVTETLRRRDVVGKFVEFFGPGVATLSVPDRATISNMAPEYGATVGLFPIDNHTIKYLLMTGRDPAYVKFVEKYAKLQGLFTTDYNREARYSMVVEIDLDSVEPSIAGPANPEDRIRLGEVKKAVSEILSKVRPVKTASNNSVGSWHYEGGAGGLSIRKIDFRLNGEEVELADGAVVIAAITSCTNTSNPSVMIGAGLLARNAVNKGLRQKPYVKTSLAPGSAVVTDYLAEAGLLPYLAKLGFEVVGYGCTTCIGNSGPLIPEVEDQIRRSDLFTVAVLSGNRNFEGRIHPSVKASFLASPILVVAYAIAGRIDIDFPSEPLGYSDDGAPVYLKDIWPDPSEVREIIESKIKTEMFRSRYEEIFSGVGEWDELKPPAGDTFSWDTKSTYIVRPPYFEDFKKEPEPVEDIRGARVLLLLGDRVTTDHISPAGAIPPQSPAGQYLRSIGVDPVDFNTYGSRRGNHEVMIRGTFANHRLKNYLLPEGEGWWTLHFPDRAKMTVYDAAMRYRSEGVPLIVLAGKQYGAGSSRDWAAKGTRLLGVRAVIAESFERIHRSNLVGMGVLPLQFEAGTGWRSLGLTGSEVYDLELNELRPGGRVRVTARREDGSVVAFYAVLRLDTPVEVEYYRHGGILPYVVREILKSGTRRTAAI
ncbi:MAG: aconitate hydratase AcnA [Nitrososphaerota archaeon]